MSGLCRQGSAPFEACNTVGPLLPRKWDSRPLPEFMDEPTLLMEDMDDIPVFRPQPASHFRMANQNGFFGGSAEKLNQPEITGCAVVVELNRSGRTNTQAVNTPNAACDPVISNMCHGLILKGIKLFGAASGASAPKVVAPTAKTNMARPRDSMRRKQGNRIATQTRPRAI